jgi:predicted phosphodiesterase
MQTKAATLEPLPFTVEHANRNVAVVRLNVSGERWEQSFLLRGDVHWDNPQCNRELELKHLREAKERGAGIIDVGDLFCLMQGKYDPRKSMDGVRPEHQKKDYLGSVIRTATDYYAPYAHNFIVIGRGNHEQSIQERNGFDMTTAIVSSLNTRTGSNIQAGGYGGWVRFMLLRGTRRNSLRLHYMHGYGGGGPVTQDLIQDQRRRTYVEGADVMVSGHTHDAWAVDTNKIRLNESNVVESRTVWSVKVPTYKDEFRDGYGGWHVETGKPPKPTGAWWLTISIDGQHRYQTNITRAR